MNFGLTILIAAIVLLPGPAGGQIITTIAGNHTEGFSGAGGPATRAEIGFLYGVAVDKAGNIYTADQANNVIWKVGADGTISLYAGTGIQGYSGDGGAAAKALLYAPAWVGLDPGGNLYFTDQQGIYIRKVSALGIITTVAGNPAQHFSGGDGGPFGAATFNTIRGIVPDAFGNIYISDNNTIRKVDASGTITTIAGTGTSGYSGDGGPAILAQLNEPYGVAVDKKGDIYIPDANNNIVRMIDPSGIINTIAGTSQFAGYSGDGGPAVAAKFDFPWAIAVDNNGNLYVDDEGNWEIRKIDPSGTITAYGGSHLVGYSGDGGPATEAEISYPTALACDQSGNLYLTDIYNYVLRVIRPCVAVAGTSNPAVSIATPTTTVCSGTPILFTAAATDGGASPSYQWEVNGVPAGPDSVLFPADSLADGDVVSCVMTAAGSCRAPVASNPISMTVNPSPSVHVRTDTAIAFGQSLVLSAVTTGPVAGYAWAPSTGLNSATAEDPVATPEVTTQYRLTVDAGNGCSAWDTVTVAVYRKFQLPNAFTPNSDGRNDVFRLPPGVGVRLISLIVYNRMGEQVFRTSQADEGWDGTAGGLKQPAGTYIWVIAYEDPLTGKRIHLKGTVLLVR